MNEALRPLHLFVNIPFCRSRCAFCNSQVYIDSPEAQRIYCDALKKEIASAAPDFADSEVHSVLLGGGSPTALEHETLASVVREIRRSFAVAEDAEWTVQVSPNMITGSWMPTLEQCGINRVSVGMVTGRQPECELLGMASNLPSTQTTLILLQVFRLASYETVLLYGLPGQDEAKFDVSLRYAVRYNTPEITLLPLQPPTGAAWMKRKPSLPPEPDAETVKKMLRGAAEHLTERGYTEYLPGHWSKGGYRCQDLLGRQNGEDYLSFGAGVTSRTDGVVYRTCDDRLKYIAHSDDPEAIYQVAGIAEQ